MNKIYNENCLDTMKRMDDNSIDLVLTSPPYDNMRKYGGTKTYHQRLNDTGYSFKFEDIANELTRTLKEGGVIFWNVADQTIKGSRTGNSMKQALYFMEECGLQLWDHIIWYKTGTPFPNNVRYRNVWENLYVFSKGKPSTFNPILKKNKTGGTTQKRKNERNHQGVKEEVERTITTKEYGIDDNVWYINNYIKKDKDIKEHPAIMTDEIATRAIKSYTNENDLVYDPFLGSGTTTRISKELNRRWIGSELYEPYFKTAEKIMKK